MHKNRIGKLIRAIFRHAPVGHNNFHFIRRSIFVIQGIRFHRDCTGLGIDLEHVGGGSRDIHKLVSEGIPGIPRRINVILGGYGRQNSFHRRVFGNGNREFSVLHLALVKQGLVVHGEHLDGHLIGVLGLVIEGIDNLERKLSVLERLRRITEVIRCARKGQLSGRNIRRRDDTASLNNRRPVLEGTLHRGTHDLDLVSRHRCLRRDAVLRNT